MTQRIETPIACDLTQIPAAERMDHIENQLPTLFRAATEMKELDTGYALGFNKTAGIIPQIAQFVDNERLCCPFFSFVIDITPGDAPVWLRITGPDGVKELLGGMFAYLTNPPILIAGSHTSSHQ